MISGSNPIVWKVAQDCSLVLGEKSTIMGILNVTPDSFSDGGDFVAPNSAVQRATQMADEGAAIIDIGGESTRPGAESVDGEAERKRILPIIEQVSSQADEFISVDTYRAKTAEAGIEAGAHIINDVWGCQREPGIAEVAARTGAGLVIMNTRRNRTVANDLIEDARAFLGRSLEIATKAGVNDAQIVLDPGFGFAETIDHDIPILNRLEELRSLGFPLLVGTSRKRFLGAITGREAPERGVATAATSVVARLKGAAIFRVHDISENRDALAVADSLNADSYEREHHG